MLHYLIGEALGVRGASVSGNVTTQFGWSPYAVFGPGEGARPDGHLLALGHAPLIHRLIRSDRLYYPGPVVGRTCILQPLYLCLEGEVVRSGVRLELSFCPGHEVAG